MLIHYFLEASTRSLPDKVALVHEEVRATYREINAAANRLAHWLLADNVLPGDRVAILLENSLEYVISYYGILKAGAVAVPLSTDHKPESLRPLLAELEAKAIISNSRFERLLQATELPPSLSLIISQPKKSWPSSLRLVAWDEVLAGDQSTNPDLSLPATSLASIIYTSGSTGKPKGVMLSHHNIVSNTNSICSYLQLTADDIQMVVLPFFYVMGKSLLNTHVAVGGRLIINNKFAFPATVLQQMAAEQVTGFAGVPSTYAYLLHRSPLKNYRDKLPALRYCSQAGGHMATTVKEELRRTLPDHTAIVIMYGATEASARLTYLDPANFADKIESIGKPIPGVSMKVVDENGLEVAVGEMGELVATGANIAAGYWRDPETTAKKFDHQGYHTGDHGYVDVDGFFHIIGRKDNLLKVGGHRINTQEIEDDLLAGGQVVEAAVVGLPDPLLGNRLAALVVPASPEATREAIIAACAARLPKYKLPATIKLLRALPKKASGKIDRDKCRSLVD
ncbi:MAG: acyl--CoA ligase [Deltaproteobacteria bacterium]|nr:acyl--CoA ligase [Candidatus Anaeroferrophillus wilburensis]MBN2889417.1 acyl--CoA ligase [Deltaproteobacteria bacterium]